MPPYSLNRREYGQFKEMLEKALLEIRLPAGIVDTDNIVRGCIRPQNCKMDATWDFQGIVSAGGNVLNASFDSVPQQNINEREVPQRSVATNEYSDAYSPTVTEPPEQDGEEVVFLDALKRKVIYTLPPASKNLGKKIYVKRTDEDSSNICRIETFDDDKIDNVERIILAVREAVILFAAADKWHILSRYTP